MTRERAKEICDIIETHGIEVIKAYGEGKVIQHLNLDNEWIDCDMPIAFVNNHSFRVKPEETDHSCNCKGCKYINLESVDEPCCNCVDSDKYKKEKQNGREYITTLQEHYNELLTTCKEKQDKIVELEKELEHVKKVQVVEHFEAYGQCRDSRRIASLETEVASLKDELTKAKELIKEFIDSNSEFSRFYAKWNSEQFLKEFEND